MRTIYEYHRYSDHFIKKGTAKTVPWDYLYTSHCTYILSLYHDSTANSRWIVILRSLRRRILKVEDDKPQILHCVQNDIKSVSTFKNEFLW